MSISTLVEVFRMNELSEATRVRLIIKLGRAINDEVGMNLTEPIVLELVGLLDENNPILSDENYLRIK